MVDFVDFYINQKNKNNFIKNIISYDEDNNYYNFTEINVESFENKIDNLIVYYKNYDLELLTKNGIVLKTKNHQKIIEIPNEKKFLNEYKKLFNENLNYIKDERIKLLVSMFIHNEIVRNKRKKKKIIKFEKKKFFKKNIEFKKYYDDNEILFESTVVKNGISVLNKNKIRRLKRKKRRKLKKQKKEKIINIKI